jgi:glycosyltransferase involved in cell wall biosynthesis
MTHLSRHEPPSNEGAREGSITKLDGDGEPFISVVSPVYRAEELVHSLLERLHTVLGSLGKPYEIILVEDRSPDKSWDAILRASRSSANVRAFRLSRNFGQHYAISAGLHFARGRWVVVMDCDLQDQPEEIPKMLEKAESGFEIVLGRRAERQDSLMKRLSSRAFYGVLGYLTGHAQDPAIANFGVYDRRVIAAINSMPETIRYFPTMVRWTGFTSCSLDICHAPRMVGKSSYNLQRLLRLALDICLVNSDKPLRLMVGTGFLVSGVGFCFAAYTAFKAVRGEISVLGYASVMVSLWLLAGLIIVLVGVVGLYVGKCFECVKQRPPFIVAEISDPVADHATTLPTR